MTREELERAIECCTPIYDDCEHCPFNHLPIDKCIETMESATWNMLWEDREALKEEARKMKEEIRRLKRRCADA